MISFLRDDVLSIWISGGWLMIPLFVLGLLIFFSVFQLYFQLRARRYLGVDPNRWNHWVDRPEDGAGEIGHIIRFTQTGALGPATVRTRFQEVRQALLGPMQRRIRFANIIIGAAPLTGLLGTVGGMLTTFGGISSGSGSGTVDIIAKGISEALITTEIGLVLAIPSYVALSRIRRMTEELDLFLTKLETATLKRQLRAGIGMAA
jgi:biopolymer transport protein ExbB